VPISIHLPAEILNRVDRRARGLGLSRSRYIAQALGRDLESGGAWSEGFFDQLRDLSHADTTAAASLSDVVHRRSSRKRAPRL
jgi:hypothetical protein